LHAIRARGTYEPVTVACEWRHGGALERFRADCTWLGRGDFPKRRGAGRGDTPRQGHGKEAQRSAARKSSGIDSTIRSKAL